MTVLERFPHRLTLVTGHYGTGKTEFSVNLALALAEAERLLDIRAVRVHGGGFAGTIQAWVPVDDLEEFKTGMEALLGAGKCHVLHIRPQGGCVVAE